MKNKSKKDLAFDSERAKFRSEIRQLKGDIQSKDLQIRVLLSQIHDMESEIERLEDWNGRLLEYMDMPEEDMRRVLREKSVEAEVDRILGDFGKIFRSFGGGL